MLERFLLSCGDTRKGNLNIELNSTSQVHIGLDPIPTRNYEDRGHPRDYGSLVTTYNVLTLLLELLITVITGA